MFRKNITSITARVFVNKQDGFILKYIRSELGG